MGILICGLNGSGKSTVGKALAQRLEYRFIDVEDMYFPKDDPDYKYSQPRSKEEATKLLNKLIAEDSRFIFAAVRGDYGDKFLSALDHIIYIYVPREERDKRVFNRSYEKFGDRMLEGGDLYESENSFLTLAKNRPDDYVERWIETVNIPVIRIDGTRPVEENVEYLALVLK
ncbi:MAG: AAA family ATPase [Clostridia bacterium]|nr:AAA family ATPase [Clostridia bacterium]